MSFDIGIWRSMRPLSSEEAADTYRKICTGLGAVVESDAWVGAFYRNLIAEFPPLEELADEELDSSPWNGSPEVTDAYVIMNIDWSRAGEIEDYVRQSADRHGLLYFDPQAGQVYNSSEMGGEYPFRFQFCDGGRIVDPRPEDLRDLLQRLSSTNWYAWLEHRPGEFIQVGIGENAHAPVGTFALEYREGGPSRHYRQVTNDVDFVVEAFKGFVVGSSDWKNSPLWLRI